MLAQSFQSAAELGLAEPELSALVKVLGMLEREEIKSRPTGFEGNYFGEYDPPVGFNMSHFFAKGDCGTVACIAGWAIFVGQLNRGDLVQKRFHNAALMHLFEPFTDSKQMERVTAEQAARALRSYLTTGDPKWDEAVA